VPDFKLPTKDQGRRAVAPILLAASFLCLTVSTRSLEGLPESLGLTVFGFFQRGFSSVGGFVSDSAASIAELRRLRENYRELSAKLERYTNMERGIAELRDENKRLKDQLGFSQEIPYQRIAARIVAKDPENLYSTITIDKGFGEGIRKNMPVIALQDGIEGLVGRVIEVGRGTSKIVPLYDTKSFVAARFAGGSRTEGLVGGQGSAGEPLVMRFVKKRMKDEIQFGDLVITTGYESLYPSDVSIGRVKKVRVLDYLTSIDIELDPVLDFSRIEYVFVIKPNASGSDSDAAPAEKSDAPASGGSAPK
jgi:rod shape-determining protein MreC